MHIVSYCILFLVLCSILCSFCTMVEEDYREDVFIGCSEMPPLIRSCKGVSCLMDCKEGLFVLKITKNATRILIRNDTTREVAADLDQSPPVCPNLPRSQIIVSVDLSSKCFCVAFRKMIHSLRSERRHAIL